MELIKALQPENNDAILDKNRYNAFHGTDLDESLKSIKVEELIITGVLTNCCSETTTRDAFIRDYRLFFVGDETATVNDELHLASLNNLVFGFSHIVSTDGSGLWLVGGITGDYDKCILINPSTR